MVRVSVYTKSVLGRPIGVGSGSRTLATKAACVQGLAPRCRCLSSRQGRAGANNRFQTVGVWTYGYPFTRTRRQQRIAEEVALLQEARFQVTWDQAEGNWVRIDNFPLPGPEHRATRLVIHIPADYPNAPPAGIHVDGALPLKGRPHAVPPPNGPAESSTWQWFCFHVERGGGGWRASTQVAFGDNLLKYVKLVFALLRDRGGYG